MYFTVIDNGTSKKLNIIHTFSNNNNNYLIYQDDNNEIYASKYHIKDGLYLLDPIETDMEWDLVDKQLERLDDKNE